MRSKQTIIIIILCLAGVALGSVLWLQARSGPGSGSGLTPSETVQERQPEKSGATVFAQSDLNFFAQRVDKSPRRPFPGCPPMTPPSCGARSQVLETGSEDEQSLLVEILGGVLEGHPGNEVALRAFLKTNPGPRIKRQVHRCIIPGGFGLQ